MTEPALTRYYLTFPYYGKRHIQDMTGNLICGRAYPSRRRNLYTGPWEPAQILTFHVESLCQACKMVFSEWFPNAVPPPPQPPFRVEYDKYSGYPPYEVSGPGCVVFATTQEQALHAQKALNLLWAQEQAEASK